MLAARHQAGELSDACYAAAYFMTWQTALHGKRYASRTAKSDPRPDAGAWPALLETASSSALEAALLRAFERQHFLGIIPNVAAAFAAWLRAEWPLTLILRIPSPAEVLDMQVLGTRPVTVVADPARAAQPVLTKANGFAFLVHDMEHAYKFYHDPQMHRGQRRFFQLLRDTLRRGALDAYRPDPAFAERLDYVMSDMNTHVVHSLRFLGAVLIECLLRREGKGMREALSAEAEAELADVLRDLGESWRFPPGPQAALARLTRGGFSEADAALIESAVLANAVPAE